MGEGGKGLDEEVRDEEVVAAPMDESLFAH
jgi:hypothetical protein